MEKQQKLCREREVLEMAGGICGMTLRRWTAAGQFPKPIVINRRRFWTESALVAWQRKLEVA